MASPYLDYKDKGGQAAQCDITLVLYITGLHIAFIKILLISARKPKPHYITIEA